jgi:hypothetical protein
VEIGTTRAIDDRSRQGFIQWSIGAAKAGNTAPLSE